MNMLELKEVVKQYGNHTAVNGISLNVNGGEIYGLLGGNGAGKTTTMRMVLGLIYPDGGNIQYEGKPYSKELQRTMGYLPEERGLYPKVKVSEQINYLGRLRGMSAKEADKSLRYWLERFGVPEYYDKRIEELSKGNQQKMGFIAAVVHRPTLLILDEAFSGLDPVNVELLKDTVKSCGTMGLRFYSRPTAWSMWRNCAVILRFCIAQIQLCREVCRRLRAVTRVKKFVSSLQVK